MNQKGLVPIFIFVFLLIIAGVGSISYYIYTKDPFLSIPELNESTQTTFTISPSPSITFIPTSKPETLPTIKIKGDEDCKSKTQETLNLLQSKAENYYQMVIKYIGVIECANQGSGMYSWESPPRYQVGKATYGTGVMWYAGTIVHDSCHSKQYHDNLSTSNTTPASNKVLTEKEAEKQCLDVQYDALKEMGADQNTLDYVKNSINSEYWNIEYNKRWW